MDGRLWFGEKGKGCEVAMLIMNGSSLRSTSRSECRRAACGNRGRPRHRILVAADPGHKKALCVVVTDPSVGESPATFGRLLDGAIGNVGSSPA